MRWKTIPMILLLLSVFLFSLAGMVTEPYDQRETAIDAIGFSFDEPNSPAVRYWAPASGKKRVLLTIAETELMEQAVPKRANPKLVVFLYHNLVFGRTGNTYNRDIYNFEHDLAFIRRNFRVADFDELIEIAEGRSQVDTDIAILTFDDGDLSMYAIAFPLLQEYNLKATFFIVPSYVGEIGYMSWEQIHTMADYRDVQGSRLFSFGSHSYSHRPLAQLQAEDVKQELLKSKHALEVAIGQAINILALPFGSGRRDPMILQTAEALGYQVVRHSDPGALSVDSINLFDVNALNVENYSTDVLVTKVLALLGR
jgi:peptidoglycan/xylan/chitin deacetylase (PgdA/CDA1 family)